MFDSELYSEAQHKISTNYSVEEKIISYNETPTEKSIDIIWFLSLRHIFLSVQRRPVSWLYFPCGSRLMMPTLLTLSPPPPPTLSSTRSSYLKPATEQSPESLFQYPTESSDTYSECLPDFIVCIRGLLLNRLQIQRQISSSPPAPPPSSSPPPPSFFSSC